MSAPKHTEEPWRYDAQGAEGIIVDAEGNTVILAQCLAQPGPAGLVGRQLTRIVACVNACAGMDDPAAIISGLSVARETLATVAAQRDELLAALRVTTDVLAEVYAKYSIKIGPFSTQCQKANVIGRAAIAKVRP